MAEPSIVITVAERPRGLNAAARLYCETSVGPMPTPITRRQMAIAPMLPTNGSATVPATRIDANVSHRARSVNRAGNSATPRARAAEPMPIAP